MRRMNEQLFRDLMDRLERCTETERPAILEKIGTLTPHVFFTRQEWFVLSARLNLANDALRN